MPTGDQYRVTAVEFGERARNEHHPMLRAEYENLSLSYLRLANLADKNGMLDIVYETPPQRVQRQVQQQQQVQPEQKTNKS
jgi:hypothetical protein